MFGKCHSNVQNVPLRGIILSQPENVQSLLRFLVHMSGLCGSLVQFKTIGTTVQLTKEFLHLV